MYKSLIIPFPALTFVGWYFRNDIEAGLGYFIIPKKTKKVYVVCCVIFRWYSTCSSSFSNLYSRQTLNFSSLSRFLLCCSLLLLSFFSFRYSKALIHSLLTFRNSMLCVRYADDKLYLISKKKIFLEKKIFTLLLLLWLWSNWKI